MTTAGRIALDVMGGDHAPRQILEGALRATDPNRDDGLHADRILLVGPRAQLSPILAEHNALDRFEILDSVEVIGMHEEPGTALRAKSQATIPMCIKAVRSGDAAAAVSMGNTGAMVGAATIILRTLPGVRRPGIAITSNLTGKPMTLLDMGANAAPRGSDLVEYAIMGAALQEGVLGVKNPRVGLLNIGEEDKKGTALTKEAWELLVESGLNFVGNIEPDGIFTDCAEVIVTDGFTGNVVLKLIEGFGSFLLDKIVKEGKRSGQPLPDEVLDEAMRSVDYSEYGGALLLGVNGVVVIGHGRSDSNAVVNALKVAAKDLDSKVNDKTVEALAQRAKENPAP
jgi:glycerol-3-phosphate acyltransferase PlsX